MESRRKGGKVGNKVDARDETRERHEQEKRREGWE